MDTKHEESSTESSIVEPVVEDPTVVNEVLDQVLKQQEILNAEKKRLEDRNRQLSTQQRIHERQRREQNSITNAALREASRANWDKNNLLWRDLRTVMSPRSYTSAEDYWKMKFEKAKKEEEVEKLKKEIEKDLMEKIKKAKKPKRRSKSKRSRSKSKSKKKTTKKKTTKKKTIKKKK